MHWHNGDAVAKATIKDAVRKEILHTPEQYEVEGELNPVLLFEWAIREFDLCEKEEPLLFGCGDCPGCSTAMTAVYEVLQQRKT